MPDTAQPDTQALVIDNVTKLYQQWQRSGQVRDLLKNLLRPQKKTVTALDNLSFTVHKGEFLAYAGANGAGKSTTIKILCGILQPTSGRVRVLGLDPVRDRIRLMGKIGIVFGQRTELWWDHPVITSFEWKKTVWNVPEETYRRNLSAVTGLLDLGGLLHTFARELSLGQRMRADLGLMLLHDPEVIFLDEPTLGLDVLAKRQMIDFLKRINRERGTTIIVTSHDMDDLEEMARRLILLSAGKIAFDGGFEALRRIQGNLCRISVTTAGSIPSMPQGLRLVGSQQNKHEYEFDRAALPLSSVLQHLSQVCDVTDVEIKKAPIEQIIASLYQSWKS